MSSLFGGKKKRVRLPPPPPPEDVEDARRRLAQVERQRQGRAATILTSGQGVTGDPIVGRATLLG